MVSPDHDGQVVDDFNPHDVASVWGIQIQHGEEIDRIASPYFAIHTMIGRIANAVERICRHERRVDIVFNHSSELQVQMVEVVRRIVRYIQEHSDARTETDFLRFFLSVGSQQAWRAGFEPTEQSISKTLELWRACATVALEQSLCVSRIQADQQVLHAKIAGVLQGYYGDPPQEHTLVSATQRIDQLYEQPSLIHRYEENVAGYPFIAVTQDSRSLLPEDFYRHPTDFFLSDECTPIQERQDSSISGFYREGFDASQVCVYDQRVVIKLVDILRLGGSPLREVLGAEAIHQLIIEQGLQGQCSVQEFIGLVLDRGNMFLLSKFIPGKTVAAYRESNAGEDPPELRTIIDVLATTHGDMTLATGNNIIVGADGLLHIIDFEYTDTRALRRRFSARSRDPRTPYRDRT